MACRREERERWPPGPYCLAATPVAGYCRVHCSYTPLDAGARESVASDASDSFRSYIWAMREARLRPEFAHLYPGLTPGRWEPASRIAEAVLANVLLHKMGEAFVPDRLLDEAHFEFRGGADSDREARSERASDS